jgi:hypothetical protein
MNTGAGPVHLGPARTSNDRAHSASFTYPVNHTFDHKHSHSPKVANPHLFVLLTMIERYEPELKLGTLIARMSIFVIPFWIFWMGLLAVFYFGYIPVGPGVGVHLPTP